MDEDSIDSESFSGSLWAVQPGWVKAFVTYVALPCWIGMTVLIFFEPFQARLFVGLFCIFGIGALLELIFIARAFWRLKI